mmetsp:Transcript_93018/g.265589  ORF Transcript_93018/g.265589 Transcript_93018/m.265589 type:complete len:373 (+) Transcript_93018:165-1283(+)
MAVCELEMAETKSTLLCVIAALSLLSSAWIMTQPYVYWRRHGSRPGPILELVSCKAFCDFLSVLKWLISTTVGRSANTHAGAVCTTLGALGQASALGSASFSFVITLDLYLMVKAPLLKLRSHDSRTSYGRYMFYCWAISVGTALVPLTNGAYGPSGDGTCWISEEAIGARTWEIFLFYGPSVAYALFSIFVLGHLAVWYFRRILPTYTQALLMQRMTIFTAIYLVSWSCGTTVHMSEFFGAPVSSTVCTADAFLLMSLGFGESANKHLPSPSRPRSHPRLCIRGHYNHLNRAGDVLVWFTSYQHRKSSDIQTRDTLALADESAESSPRTTSVDRGGDGEDGVKSLTTVLLDQVRQEAETTSPLMRRKPRVL